MKIKPRIIDPRPTFICEACKNVGGKCMLLLLLIGMIGVGHGSAQQAQEPVFGSMAGQPEEVTTSADEGLLFYLSGDNNFSADFAAGGQNLPNFNDNVSVIPGGAVGSAFQAENRQLLSYWAPGNIYAQRGTLSFFWRSRYPVGPTPFPVFRVGFADHSSWDMVWLRIDYNGSGFDAFVTDVGLARTRVSYHMDEFPSPEEWTHIVLSWDETEGIRLYINGNMVKKKTNVGQIYDTGLDQLGPHSRIISPYQVQSRYNFIRGGDLDELRVYDRMLSDENITTLAQGKVPKTIPDKSRDLSERKWREEWWTRNGWNRPNDPPAVLPASGTTVRKVEIHDVVDINRWTWKGTDGIRETTWPGVYNMSRIPGRYDYFVLPDWDAYSVSGQTVKFSLPDEPWNHIEMWGTAWGQLTYEDSLKTDYTFAVRTKDQVKSYHELEKVRRGGDIRFDNALIEEPIGEFGVYYVHEGRAPADSINETFTLAPAPVKPENKALQEVAAFVDGRFPSDERQKMVGLSTAMQAPARAPSTTPDAHPLIHLMIPYSNHPDAGLDGVEIQLPAMDLNPTHGDVFPLNLRIKDPLWQMRDLADFSFSVNPDTAYTLWLDTRDRVLPQNKALYLTLAGAGSDLTPEKLNGARIRLIYKSKEKAVKEHEVDRLTQIKDNYAFNVEEHPNSPRFNIHNRFMADFEDIMKVNPENWLARAYKYAETRNPADRPEYEVPQAPKNIPEWAFLQGEYLSHIEHVISYYIDERQISNGEFGGGLSDDNDLTNAFPAVAFLGITPGKTLRSLRLLMTAYFDQDRDPYNAPLRQRSLPLFTNGLSTITTDLLHAYEEGVELIGQLELLDYGNPLYINRGMQTAKRILDDITQVNPAGHRLFRSRYYGGTEIATEEPWQWSGARSYIMLHTSYMTVRYNGNPKLRKMIIELADGLLAHRDEEGNFYPEINFSTDEIAGDPGLSNAWQVLQAAYEYTGDEKYYRPVAGRVTQTHAFKEDSLVQRYREDIIEMGVRDYIDTKGSIWIDRVLNNFNDLQEDRLGGVAIERISNILPEHYVSWNMEAPANYKSVAFFIPQANKKRMKIMAYNMEHKTVHVNMRVWKAAPGQWRVVQGTDTNGDQKIDADSTQRKMALQRGEAINMAFAPGKNIIIKMELEEPADKGYWQRADLGINPEGITIDGNYVTVRVSSLGAIDAPPTTLVLKDADGHPIAAAPVPALQAPRDLIPKWTNVKITVPGGTDLSSGSVEVDPDHAIRQITRQNTKVFW